MPLEFKELWIFVSADADDNEAIIAGVYPNGDIMPFIAIDRESYGNLIPTAQKFAADHNQPVRVLHSAWLEQVEVISPPEPNSEHHDAETTDLSVSQ